MKNIIVNKSYSFSLLIIKLYYSLINENNEYIISKQLLKSGTSIGANVEEGQAAFSKKEFSSKNSIALKEAREVNYWLRLLRDSDILKPENFHLIDKSEELIKILTAIVKSSQNRIL